MPLGTVAKGSITVSESDCIDSAIVLVVSLAAMKLWWKLRAGCWTQNEGVLARTKSTTRYSEGRVSYLINRIHHHASTEIIDFSGVWHAWNRRGVFGAICVGSSSFIEEFAAGFASGNGQECL